MRPYVHTLLLLACCTMYIPAMAQGNTASEWYDRAAHAYVKQDKLTALRILDRGLAEHPNDGPLKALAEALLKEDQQQQQQQQPKDQQQGGQGQKEKEKEQQQNKDQQTDQRSENEQDRPADGTPQPPPSSGTPGAQGAGPGRIDPKDARRMLDALQRNEREVQMKVRQRMRPAQRLPIDKDW